MHNPIVFFGTDEELAVAPLLRLIEAGYNVVAIVTAQDGRAGRGRKLTTPKVKEIGLAHGIPVFQPERSGEIRNILEKITGVKTEPTGLIGVLAAYGKIIPRSVLEWFEPYGIMNVHPSLLPKYRGPSPIETAMADGETEFGVTIIKLAAAMDAGPIYAQAKMGGDSEPSKAEVYAWAAATGIRLIEEKLPAIAAETAQGAMQDENQATYTEKLTKEMSALLPAEKTAKRLHDEVRAYLGFPKSKLTVCGVNCVITATHVAETPETEIDLACADGKYLVIERLVPEGRGEMNAAAFLNGLHGRN
jgi:methionyl-tRNA formyltransferase